MIHNHILISRKEAMGKGLTYFFTGKPCNNGHVADRYVKGGKCCICSRGRCHRYAKKKKSEILARAKTYREKNREKMIIYLRNWHRSNRDKVLEKRRENYVNNRDKILSISKIYAQNNKEKRNLYQRNRRRKDPAYKVSLRLRIRMHQAINSNQKTGSGIRDLGCSVEEFKKYLSSKFRDGMNWDNWGTVWELDHIEPVCSFDLTNREQFLKAAHYTNLQPLLIEEHRTKTKEDKKKSIRVCKETKPSPVQIVGQNHQEEGGHELR